MFQKFQNLRQGSRTVDEYATYFFKMINRVEVRDTEEQLTMRFVGGLRQQIQYTLNLFRPQSLINRPSRWKLKPVTVSQLGVSRVKLDKPQPHHNLPPPTLPPLKQKQQSYRPTPINKLVHQAYDVTRVVKPDTDSRCVLRVTDAGYSSKKHTRRRSWRWGRTNSWGRRGISRHETSSCSSPIMSSA